MHGCQARAIAQVSEDDATSRRVELKQAWDRFHVPLPFGRCAVVYGEPVKVGPDDDLPAKAAELEAAMNRATDEAERLVS